MAYVLFGPGLPRCRAKAGDRPGAGPGSAAHLGLKGELARGFGP